jgi:hypothetical protein
MKMSASAMVDFVRCEAPIRNDSNDIMWNIGSVGVVHSMAPHVPEGERCICEDDDDDDESLLLHRGRVMTQQCGHPYCNLHRSEFTCRSHQDGNKMKGTGW